MQRWGSFMTFHNTTKRKVFFLLLTIFMCVGIMLTFQMRFEQKKVNANLMLRKDGQNTLKLISLAYERFTSKIQEPASAKDEHLFLKVLSQTASNKKIAYIIIQRKDSADKPVIALPSADITRMIPAAIQTASLSKPGFQIQDFTSADQTAYIELSQPIYGQGDPFAVVRLGIKPDQSGFFEIKNLILPLQMLFFIGMGMVCIYYWFMLMFKPLRQVINETGAGLVGRRDLRTNISTMVMGLETLMTDLLRKKQEAEQEKNALEAKMKIIEYENNQLFDILNSLDFGILLIDTKDNLFFINDFFLTLLNKERDPLMNQTVFEVLDHSGLNTFIRQLRLIEHDSLNFQMEVTFPDTRPEQTFLVSAHPLIDHDDTIFGRVVKLTDISQEKATEKSQKDFMNHIAHELRTPLTNIKAYNEMIMDGEIEDQEMQKEFFNTINDETNRLSDLIKSILELAETEMGQMTAKKEMVKTQWLVESTINAVEAMALEKGIALTTHLPDNLPNISGDKEMLKAALINVLGNAVKYTPEGGSATFSLRETRDMVCFEVEDTGYGIEQKDLPHVFEKFYRSENDQVAAQTGSGLGLAITAEIVKSHGGTIEVSSELTKGSKFTITIPKGDLQIG